MINTNNYSRHFFANSYKELIPGQIILYYPIMYNYLDIDKMLNEFKSKVFVIIDPLELNKCNVSNQTFKCNGKSIRCAEQYMLNEYGISDLNKLTVALNEVDGLQFGQNYVLRGYMHWKRRIITNIFNSQLSKSYLSYKSNENKGYKFSHDIIRQFDINCNLYQGIHQFLAVYNACYSHMATEIPCEKIGKQIKGRLCNRERMGRTTLNKEIIIASNGPSISNMNAFILEASRIYLQNYRPPIAMKSKYNISRVIDKHNSKISNFVW